jgi:hypothetical protein
VAEIEPRQHGEVASVPGKALHGETLSSQGAKAVRQADVNGAVQVGLRLFVATDCQSSYTTLQIAEPMWIGPVGTAAIAKARFLSLSGRRPLLQCSLRSFSTVLDEADSEMALL